MSGSFVDNYKSRHRHPLNKLSHAMGIPMIVLSLPLFFFSWRWALGLFVCGWMLGYASSLLPGRFGMSGL